MNAFFALSKHLQQRIDDAFHFTIDAHKDTLPSEPPLKKQKLNADEGSSGIGAGGGGFILDDPDIDISATTGSGGGFLIEDHEPLAGSSSGGGGFLTTDEPSSSSPSPSQSRIPLSSIPSALQLLELPPDDEVMTIFRNAASGWDSSGSNSSDNTALMVTQDDWRAVCAVLVEPFGSTTGVEGEGGGFLVADEEEPEDDQAEADSDFQMLSEDDADDQDPNESDSDYYEPGPSSSIKKSSSASRRIRSRPKSTGKRRARRNNDDDDFDFDDKLTSSQKSACLEAFAMFFSDTHLNKNTKNQNHPSGLELESDIPLQNRRIMLTDIQRVTKLLGEKLTAEDMLDMLDAFSTSPDKSMGLEDFERMMVVAKLV